MCVSWNYIRTRSAGSLNVIYQRGAQPCFRTAISPLGLLFTYFTSWRGAFHSRSGAARRVFLFVATSGPLRAAACEATRGGQLPRLLLNHLDPMERQALEDL